MKNKTSFSLCSAILFSGQLIYAQDTYTYDGVSGVNPSSWLVAPNWLDGIDGKFPGVDGNPSTTADGSISDIALFSNRNNNSRVGINFNRVNGGANETFTLGAITYVPGSGSSGLTIGNSGNDRNGVLTLTGVTVNSESNVVIRNSTGQHLIFENAVGSSNKQMNLAFTNSTESKIVVDGNGNIEFESIIEGTSPVTITGTGSGSVVMRGANTYTGMTKIDSGATLVLAGASVSESVAFVTNGTLDASSATFNVELGQTLRGSGTVKMGEPGSVGQIALAGVVAPGNSGGSSIGTLKIIGNAIWSGETAWEFNLGGGHSSDKLEITGEFLRGGSGSSFAFDFMNSSVSGIFNLVTWTESTDFSEGDFSAVNIGGGRTGTFSITDKTLQFTAVPESSNLIVSGLIGLGLLRRRRR